MPEKIGQNSGHFVFSKPTDGKTVKQRSSPKVLIPYVLVREWEQQNTFVSLGRLCLSLKQN